MNVTEMIIPDVIGDFNDIKIKYDVEDEAFVAGVRFCLGFTSNETRIEAFMSAFPDTDRTRAGKLSGYYIKKGFIDSLLTRMYAGNNLMYSDVRNKVITRMGNLALDDDASHKNSIDAAKVFLENTKMPESIVVDHKFEIDENSQKAMDSFMGVMEAISKGHIGMMNPEGEIIDVKEIE